MPGDRTARTRVGTSGWRYRHWRGVFYPERLRMREWLAHYASVFDCVEVDASFYALPEPDTLAAWRDATPDGFLFAVKAPRAITHHKKLKNCENEVQRLAARLDVLGDRLGPVLFQLPARWRVNARRLEAFLAALPADRRYAFELRDPSWHVEEIYALLRARRAAFSVFDLERQASPIETTSDLVYVRLGAPQGAPSASYRHERLRRWAGDALGWNRAGRDAFVFLDNDERGWATRNAESLRILLGEGAGTAARSGSGAA